MKSIFTIAASTILLASLTSARYPTLYNHCRCRGPAPKGQQGPDLPDKTKLACEKYNAGTYNHGVQSFVQYDERKAECIPNGQSLVQDFWNDVCKKEGAGSGQCWNDVPPPGWGHCRCRGPAPKGQPPYQGPDMPPVTRRACGEYNGMSHNGWTASVYWHDDLEECCSEDGSLDPEPWGLYCPNDGAASGQCW